MSCPTSFLSRSFVARLVLLLLVPSIAPAFSVIHVDRNAAGAGDGTSWTDAYVELRDALASAADLPGVETVEVWIAAGSYAPAASGGSRSTPFALFRGYELYGGFSGVEVVRSERDPAANLTVLTGDLDGDDLPGFVNVSDNSIHVIWSVGATGGSRVLDGITVRGGYADGLSYGGKGAGLLAFSQTVRATNCVFEENLALLDGGGIYNEGSSVFTSCVIRNNRADNRGGGMFNNWASPRLTDCEVHDNLAAGLGGGGTYNEHGRPVFTNCTYADNSADASLGNGYGGGMSNNASVVTLNGCLFLRNSAAALGGAILNSGGSSGSWTDCTFQESALSGGVTNLGSTPNLVRCLFLANEGRGSGAFDNGGGGNPTLIHCRFLGNSATGVAGDGGGFRNSGGSSFLFGCLFSGNFAARNGGAMAAYSPTDTITLINCTMAENTAVFEGGGVYSSSTVPVIVLSNSVVWRNSHLTGAGQSAQLKAPGPGVFVVNYSCVKGWNGALGGAGNTGANPLFEDAAGPDLVNGTPDDNLRLSVGSPSADAGNNALLPPDVFDLDGDGDLTEAVPFDLDGSPRQSDDPVAGDVGPGISPLVDMGTYETQDPATHVSEGPPPAVSGTGIFTISPNPFNPNVSVRFELAQAGVARLAVYGASGRLVTTLRHTRLPAGEHEVRWNGTGDNGDRVASGVYFIVLDAAGTRSAARATLIR